MSRAWRPKKSHPEIQHLTPLIKFAGKHACDKKNRFIFIHEIQFSSLL